MPACVLTTPEPDPSAAELIAARPWLCAHAMDGLLFDRVKLAAIAAEHGTPSWVYSAPTLRARFARLRRAMPGLAIHYAVKANGHLAILSLLAAEGAGADVVSGGEFLRALAAGIPAGRIVFSGVGKTGDELALAAERGAGQINVESPEELFALSDIAATRGLTVRVALRVNPDVDAGTHEKISTGRAGDKFGILHDDIVPLYRQAVSLPGIAPAGLAVHIGSQILATAPFTAAYGRVAGLVRVLRAENLPIETVDCGGGLGIAYRGEPECQPEAWAGAIHAAFDGLALRLSIEPGRWLAGPSGLLLASVIRTRRLGMARPCVVLDAAMNDLARPAMYGAWHGILPIDPVSLVRPPECCDVAGPVCESSDMFGRDRALAKLPDGALVAILDTGAYGAVMSSTYNARPLAAQILIDSGGFTPIRRRQMLAELWSAEIMPGRTAPA